MDAQRRVREQVLAPAQAHERLPCDGEQGVQPPLLQAQHTSPLCMQRGGGAHESLLRDALRRGGAGRGCVPRGLGCTYHRCNKRWFSVRCRLRCQEHSSVLRGQI